MRTAVPLASSRSARAGSPCYFNCSAELRRSQPDYVVYQPRGQADTGNEHLLVFDAPDGSLMALWTQSSFEGAGDHRIVLSISRDEGLTWSAPRRIVGPQRVGQGPPASWGFPLVSRGGRIYVVYQQHRGIEDAHADPSACWTGTMDCVFSDDLGVTWSSPQTIPWPRGPHDNPDASVPPSWIVWQIPMCDLRGRWLAGYTRWVSRARRTPPHIDSWTAWESVVEFVRFENVDDDPPPRELQISFSAWGDSALRVPHYSNPALSIAQEPSLVRLPDERLLCVMRTMAGWIAWSMSDDDGASWSEPRPLLRRDGGPPIPQPLCCCPIYPTSDGRFVLLHHNNDGRLDGCLPEETMKNRRPAFLALGEYRADAEQPIWFSESKLLMDSGGVGLGPKQRIDIGVYSSFTRRNGVDVLWHADRKFYLVGKRIARPWLSDLSVPLAAHQT